MSLGLAVNHGKLKKRSDGQFVADLASLFERRRIALGEPHVCEQFEILLTTSDAFRSQLFTLCTAISHMSEHDLSGEELLDLLARALRAHPEGGSALPAVLRQNFLSGLEAWNNRGTHGEDEWPPLRKPVASVAHPDVTAPAQPTAHVPDPPAQSNAALRPAGVPTLQEALEKARIRGGNRPLRPELVQPTEPVPAAIASAPAGDNATAIQELNALLGEIEERMKRLRPQLGETEVPVIPERTSQRNASYLAHPEALDIFEREPSSAAAPVSTPALSLEDREAAFLARHPYLDPKRPRTAPVIDGIVDAVVTVPVKPAEAAVSTAAPVPEKPQVSPELALVPVKPQPEPELRLIPRTVELAPIEEKKRPLAPTLVIPESMRLKTYLAIAVLAGVVLVGTPISAVVAYRYMHPLYIYNQPRPQPDPAAATPQPTPAVPNDAGSGAQGKRSRHKTQSARRKPPVAVWPAEQ
ncbi:MAG TPA: hypothetical protein VJU82_06420 [Acidobacteriaceae bacterium]|nr:hypothetical protein [Acidobacteriaceae bacterium]